MVKKLIQGFGGIIIGTALGGAAIQAIGNLGSSMGAGLKGATQSLVGVGIFGHAASKVKNMFSFK